MNKKFSTLVAVLLAAGAWTTLDAKVVQVPAPVVGGSYLLGTGINADPNDFTEALIYDAVGSSLSFDALSKALSTTPGWELEEVSAGVFYLKSGGKYVTAKGTSGAQGTALTIGDNGGDGTATEAVKFKLVSTAPGKYRIKVSAQTGTNTDMAADLELIGGATLTLSSAANDGTGTEFEFGVYSEDAYNNLPGLNGVKTTAGVVDLTTLDATETVDAPLYITDKAGKYLSVKYDGTAKQYVLATGDDALETTAPTAAQSLNASWKWVNGNLVSVAAQRDGKVAELTVTKPVAELVYGVANTTAGVLH